MSAFIVYRRVLARQRDSEIRVRVFGIRGSRLRERERGGGGEKERKKAREGMGEEGWAGERSG